MFIPCRSGWLVSTLPVSVALASTGTEFCCVNLNAVFRHAIPAKDSYKNPGSKT